jgi:uncharacterized protein YjiS (DUF1127 family)
MNVRTRPPSGVIFRIFTAIRDYLVYSAAIRDLHRLSDVRLADMGIERHRIPETVKVLMTINRAKLEDWREGRDRDQRSGGLSPRRKNG